MSVEREFRKLLTRPTEELVRATVAGEIEWGDFLADERPHLEISGFTGGLRGDWFDLALLSSWAPAPFVIDGEPFASVESFYHALKYPPGSGERARVAGLAGPQAQRRAPRKRGTTLIWRGREIAVGSPEHCGAVGAAVSEKLKRHPSVVEVLRGTGRAQLMVAPHAYHGRNALAIATPIALMIERARLWR